MHVLSYVLSPELVLNWGASGSGRRHAAGAVTLRLCFERETASTSLGLVDINDVDRLAPQVVVVVVVMGCRQR